MPCYHTVILSLITDKKCYRYQCDGFEPSFILVLVDSFDKFISPLAVSFFDTDCMKI